MDRFLERFAPEDVRSAVAWLTGNGYDLVSLKGDSTLGAQFVFVGEAEVHVTVDRSQWLLDVAPAPGADAWQYDLLLAAQAGQDYADLFPAAGSRSLNDRLAEQLPEDVSWRHTLPAILEWVTGDDVPAAVDRALHQRHDLMWPRTGTQ